MTMSFHESPRFMSDPEDELLSRSFKTTSVKGSSGAKCVYCGALYQVGELLARAFGIKSAHTGCTMNAFREYRLVLNFVDSEMRPKELLERSLSLASSTAALDAIGSRYSLSHTEQTFRDPREPPRRITMKDRSTKERVIVHKKPKFTGDPKLEAQRLGFNTKLFRPPGTELTKCVYCQKMYQSGVVLAFARGIQHGHVVCVLEAYKESRMVLGFEGARHRPGSMRARSMDAGASWSALNAAKLSVGSVELLACGQGHPTKVGDRDRTSVGRAQMFAQAENYGFKVFITMRQLEKCVYCGEEMGPEQRVAAALGIRSGHVACSVVAYQDNRLVLDSFNARSRNTNLFEHSLSAIDSQAVLKKHGLDRSPVGMLLDDREYSRERMVFDEGAAKWPTLVEADREAMKKCSEDQALLNRARLEHGQPSPELGEVNLTARVAADGDPEGKLYKQMQGSFDRSPSDIEWAGEEEEAAIKELEAAFKEKKEEREGITAEELAHNSCCHFKQSRIMRVPMVVTARPRPHCLREVDSRTQRSLLEAQWKALGEHRFSQWRATQSIMPYCPEHEGRWGLKDGNSVHMGLEVKLLEVAGKHWVRELWWICTGEPVNWDGRPRGGGRGGYL